MGIDVTAFGLPRGFFFPLLSLSLYFDVNRTGRPKAVTSIPIFHDTKHSYTKRRTNILEIKIGCSTYQGGNYG